MATAEEVLKAEDRLKAGRTPHESDWRDLGEYLLPTRSMAITGMMPGAKITTKVFDSEGLTAPKMLSSSLHGNLTNPSALWFALEMRQPELNLLNEVQDWLEDTSVRAHAALRASNFTNEVASAYEDLPVFGPCALFQDVIPPPRPGLLPEQLFTALPIGTYYIAENHKGRVDTLYYRLNMSIRAIRQRWGERKMGKDLNDLYMKDRDQTVPILHAVYPRSDRNYESRTARNMPFTSCWVYPDKKQLIDESGYPEFPGSVCRWSRQAGEPYGRGQGHLALPDIRTLNRSVELNLMDWALDIAPPLFEIDRAVKGDLRWEPRARNVVTQREAVFTVKTGSNRQRTEVEWDRLEKKIQRIFFVDRLLAMLPTENPTYQTAFEFAKRMQQEFLLIGPAYGRITGELLGPIVERTVRVLERSGGLLPLPAALQASPDADMDIRYVGPLARAQEAEKLTGISQKNIWLQNVITVTGDQTIADNWDFDAEAAVVSRGFGVPASVTRGRDAVAKIRQVRAQQQAQAAQMQALQQVAQAAGQAAPMIKALRQAPPPGAQIATQGGP